jgi:hypothetical protein
MELQQKSCFAFSAVETIHFGMPAHDVKFVVLKRYSAIDV